jgi:hypothetical protein
MASPFDGGLPDVVPADTGPPEVVSATNGPPEVVPDDTGPPEAILLDTGPLVAPPLDTGPPEVISATDCPPEVVPVDTGPPEAAPVYVGILVAVPVYNSHAKGYNCWFVVGLFECDYTANCLAEKVEKGEVRRAEDAHESSCPNLEADKCREETYDIW